VISWFQAFAFKFNALYRYALMLALFYSHDTAYIISYSYVFGGGPGAR
jgi:hypothetical protein